MPSCQSPGEPQTRLSEIQEPEVQDWVSDEANAGTVARHDLIHWFAQRDFLRDGIPAPISLAAFSAIIQTFVPGGLSPAAAIFKAGSYGYAGDQKSSRYTGTRS